MRNLLRRFHTDCHGHFAVIASIAAVPIIGAAGIALVYGSAVLQRAELQNSLDAAVLAATSLGYSASDEERLAIAYRHAGFLKPKFGSDIEW